MHLFHKHRLRDAQQMRACRQNGAVIDVTELLYVCDCGHIKTRCVDGHWNYLDMLPDPKAVVEDFIQNEDGNASISCDEEVS